MPHTAEDTLASPRTSRQRLADISHHFLSDADEHPAPWQKTRLIPLLLIDRADDYVAYLIKAALEQDQHTCSVLNIENQTGPFSAPLTNNHPTAPDICLLPFTSPGSILAIPHEKLLMAVPASLPGVRLAYHQLAQLAAQKNHLTVHIIMLDGRDEQHAQRYFSFLKDNANSLLCQDIASIGALSQRPESTSNGDAATANIVTNILQRSHTGTSTATSADGPPKRRGQSPQTAFSPYI